MKHSSAITRFLYLLLGVSLCLGLCAPVMAASEQVERKELALKPKPPRTALDNVGLFKRDFISQGFFGEVVDVTETEKEKEIKVEEKEAKKGPESKSALEELKKQPVFVSSDPYSHILPPDEDPTVRINPEAPGPFKGMAIAFQQGDRELASKYADQFVRYQLNLLFEVRELTELIGEAMIRQKLIDDEEWSGVGQIIDYQLAKARDSIGSAIRPTHEKAMERIQPDSGGEVDVYYFFTVTCTWCRFMSPDVERLWRSVKHDKKVKMVGLLMEPTPQALVDEYKSYTGMTLPVFDGSQLAKAFHIGFAPAVIVVARNNNKAYLKTGQQTFPNMYDFLRRVQGQPSVLSPDLQKLMETPIGEVERLQAKGKRRGSLAMNGIRNTTGLKQIKSETTKSQTTKAAAGKQNAASEKKAKIADGLGRF